MITGTEPPSTDHATPATFEACSEQRKTMTAAISCAEPRRPNGTPEAVRASTSSRDTWFFSASWSARPPGASHTSSPTGPGATALTSTPRAVDRGTGPADLRLARRDHLVAGVGGRDVQDERHSPAAELRTALREGPQRVLSPAHEEGQGAFASQQLGDCAAKPARGTRHDA